MTRAHQGCNVTTCPSTRCQATGACQDVKSPSLTMIKTPLPAWMDDTPEIREKLQAAISRRTVIAFTGLAGAGKSTAAMHLVHWRGFQRVRFAGPLKAMLAALGCTPAEIDGSSKEMPCELLGGKTPRHAMQTLGTEWGRMLIAPDLWIRAWNAAVADVTAGVPVVVDDARFENEYEALRAIGATIIRIERPGAGTASVHVSEQFQIPAAIVLQNSTTQGDLFAMVDSVARAARAADK